jgi:hypothetical protein
MIIRHTSKNLQQKRTPNLQRNRKVKQKGKIKTAMPEYKRKEKEILAWLFMASIDVEIYNAKATLLLKHLSLDFLRRFKQLVKLGTYTFDTFERGTPYWRLKDPNQISFLLKQIISFIRVRHRKRLAKTFNVS